MIPQKIHYCWLSGDPFPELIVNCINSWHKHLPDYEFVLWDRKKIDIGQIVWVKEAYENKKYAFAADYIRLYALYTEGGIYLDSDVEVLKNLSPLLALQSFMGFETSGDLEPAIVGAQAGMEWLEKCLAYYTDRHFRKPDGSLDTRPLPTIVKEVLGTNYHLPKDGSKIATIEQAGLTVYPVDYFSPKSAHTEKVKITPNTYTIHHFDGNWVKKDVKYRFKKGIHSAFIRLFGQRAHNAIIQKIREI